jgi:hypothetical protein
MRDLFIQPTGAPSFNPVTGRGWRGPYLLGAGGTYQVNAGNGFIGSATLQSPEAPYGAGGDPAVMDAWLHPIVIQAPSSVATTDPNQQAVYTRLVSAGQDGIIQTSPDILYPSPTQRGDDVVVFLMRADTP